MSKSVKYEKYERSQLNVEMIKRAFIIAHNDKIRAKKKADAVNTPAHLKLTCQQ